MRGPIEPPEGVETYDSDAQEQLGELHDEPRNFFWLVVHHVWLRIGWIFKTESVVMPTFLALIGGGALLQGFLPVLNRLGLSIPPVLFSRRLKVAPRKKWALAACSFGMALTFCLLSALWYSGGWQGDDGQAKWWMPLVFLTVYGVFFALTGMNQLAAHALQGKVVQANRRGRLFTASALVGTPLAIIAALVLMPRWLGQQPPDFGALFAFTGIAFALSSVAALPLRESPDDFEQQRSHPGTYFRLAWQAMVRDQNCRRLAILAVLFSTTFMLFPHYVAVVSDQSRVALEVLTLWVCVQNGAAALFSLVAGPVADRYGTRAALHIMIAGAASAPLMGMAMLLASEEFRTNYSWLVFLPLGFTPVTIRLVVNYALEIAPRSDHPRYVSAVGLCLAAPVAIGSPLLGMLIECFGYPIAMVVGLVLLLAALVQSFRIAEPRHG